MAVRTKQLFEGAPNNGTAVYTVPSGRRTIVKNWTVSHIGNTSTCALRVGGVSGNKRMLWKQVMVADVVYRIETWVVLEAGQNLTAETNAGTPSTVTWVISGTELIL